MKLIGWLWLPFLLLCGPAGAQTDHGWSVKPEWVRAHEEFLASDALQGRGSATRDEEIAATYVASEFMGYGLTPAPGMPGYLQTAEVVQPQLNGHATVNASHIRISEGDGLTLLQSTGESVTGPLVLVSGAQLPKRKIAPGSVVLVRDVPAGEKAISLIGPAVYGGAAAVLLPSDPSTVAIMARDGGKTHIGMRLAEAPPKGFTIAALGPEALQQLAAVPEGAAVTVAVHSLPPEAPRHTFNAIGYLAGTDAKAGTILLTAHLDHLGVRHPVNGDAIWNGANDDAAGTTAVLELAHALASGSRPRRSVLFVCYGSEEAGELGSSYFGEHPPVPLKSLVANLEFEMIGNQDPKMPKGVLLLTGWDRSNLGPTLKAHGALLGPDPYPEQHFFERSDNYSLALKGVVAHTAAGWGTPPTYHQPNDDLEHLDLAFMTTAIQSLVEPVRWLATSDFVPRWHGGGQPKE